MVVTSVTRSNGGIFSGKILKPQRSSKTLLAYVRKVKVIFSLDVNKILRFQVTLYPLCAKNVITQLVLVTNKRSQCGIDHATYDLLTRQHTKTPELCSMSCGDEFDLEFNWNGAQSPVL